METGGGAEVKGVDHEVTTLGTRSGALSLLCFLANMEAAPLLCTSYTVSVLCQGQKATEPANCGLTPQEL